MNGSAFLETAELHINPGNLIIRMNFPVCQDNEKIEGLCKALANKILIENDIEPSDLKFRFNQQMSNLVVNCNFNGKDAILLSPLKINFNANLETFCEENIVNELNLFGNKIRQMKSHYIFNTGSHCTRGQKNDGNDFVFKSNESKVQKFSYLNFTHIPEIDELNSPNYMPYDLISRPRKDRLADVLNGMTIKENGELLCLDPKLIEKQKGMISDLIKSLAVSVKEGRGVVGVSLPVRIFEPRSTIERIVDWWSYLPLFLPKAISARNLTERMKFVIAFAFSSLHTSMTQWKPFNPILGETYQGEFVDGSTIHCEHISHHPPITSFYVTGDGFKFYGSYEYMAKNSKTFNEISFWQEGKSTVEFNDGTKISFNFPIASLKGMMYGERLASYSGSMVFTCNKDNLKAVINFGTYKETKGLLSGLRSLTKMAPYQYDFVNGFLYVSNGKQTPEEKKIEENQDLKTSLKTAKSMLDLETKICDIRGSYFKELYFDEKELWDIDCLRPSFGFPVRNPLPSDCRFREDLIWLKYGDEKEAQRWKLALEARQRLEKKLKSSNI